MDPRRAFEEKLEAQLQEWNAKLDLLKANADRANADAKIECYEIAEALRRKQGEAQKRLQALKASGDGEWADLKAGAEEEWAEVTDALQSAIAKFK